MKLIALQALRGDYGDVHRGDEFEPEDDDVSKMLIARGLAAKAVNGSRKPPVAVIDGPGVTRQAGAHAADYDLTGDTHSTIASGAAPQAAPTDPAPAVVATPAPVSAPITRTRAAVKGPNAIATDATGQAPPVRRVRTRKP